MTVCVWESKPHDHSPGCELKQLDLYIAIAIQRSRFFHFHPNLVYHIYHFRIAYPQFSLCLIYLLRR